MVIPILMLCIYHLVNIVTDIKYRITKNLWHVLFLLGGSTCFFYFNKGWVSYVSLLVFSLIFGIGLEILRVSAAGDTKMCIVSVILLGSFSVYSPFHTALVLFVGYILFIFILSYVNLIKQNGLKWVINNQWYDIKSLFLKTPLSQEKAIENYPGAIAISFGVGLSILYLIT